MPVVYDIDKARGLIRTRCTGNVTLQEALDHFRALESDPNCPGNLDVLLDLSAMKTKPTGDQLRSITDEMGKVSRVRFGACAVVVGSDVMFGMSRMYISLAGAYFRDAQVFRAVADAEEWLALHRSPLT
ncbi:MAG TPA: STAS/SEC14 domain-containing protein [bacterium]|nr:STAS/SEC14 domain-containing protein [bacterium]